jgi:plastocyanin
MNRGPRPRIAPQKAAWCGALVVLLFLLALAPGPASALPWGSAWSWPGVAPARAHTDSRVRCKARGSRHGRSAGHHRARCRGSHKPHHGASSTRPTTGPLPASPGGGPEENSTPTGVPVVPGAPGGGEGGAGGEGGGGSPPALVHVQITAVEFHFTLSRTTVPAGKVVFEFVNNGQDEHNLNVLSGEGSLEGSFATTESHGIRQQTITLKKGTFTLFCSLPEHEAKGMHSTLTVQ